MIIAGGGALCLMRFAALGATRRLVLETLFGVEFLFTGGESKFFAAISAGQYLISHETAYISF